MAVYTLASTHSLPSPTESTAFYSPCVLTGHVLITGIWDLHTGSTRQREGCGRVNFKELLGDDGKYTSMCAQS